jgi:hypothetical protein
MLQGQSGGVSTVAHGDQYLTAAASLVVGGAFFALWFWLLPQWLGFRVDAFSFPLCRKTSISFIHVTIWFHLVTLWANTIIR